MGHFSRNLSASFGRALFREIRARDVSVVMCHCARADVYAPVLARMVSKPVIQYVHGPEYNPSPAVRFLSRAQSPLRKLLLTNSESTLTAMRKIGFSSPARIIYNGWPDESVSLDAEQVRVLREELGLPRDAFVIGTIGRMVSVRSQIVAVEALAPVVRELPKAILVIVGDGPERSTLEARADALGVTNHVVITGWRSDIWRLLAIMDCYVNPAISEGFGNAVIEAMYSGVPVILADGGAHPELVDDGVSGILYPGDDVGALVDAILSLAADSDLRERLGDAGRATAKSRFGVEAFVVAVESVIRSSLVSRGSVCGAD